ncbi:MAG TPA: PhzF family phenazine biosynthesis protein, partial [Acidobacteriota bacterium]|nr:PhzF family phenazine biosynthesis protein [Acidobacteriota bacterium]
MRLYQVDAFTNEVFKGNPAAVCLLDAPQDDTWMQAFASEMNLSETAFLEPNDGYYRLRWFTPSIEVDLCGHATLASAHVLWETGAAKRGDPIEFDTRSGLLTASYADHWIWLNFPATPAKETTCNVDLEGALGAKPTFVGRSAFDFLAELASETLDRELNPNFALIERAASRGVIVTARSRSLDYDFVSRFFSPQSGVVEDP